MTHGLNINITRSSNNFGPSQNQEKLIPNFILRLAQNLKVPVYGDGLNIRDWLHVDDHCKGIYLVLTKGKAGEIYNIGGGTELTNLELTMRIITILGKSAESIQYVGDRLGHDQRYSVDYRKISELGYAPSKDINSSLNATINWYLS